MGWPQAQRLAKLSHKTSELLGVGESWSPSRLGFAGLSAYPRLLQDWWVPCKSWGLRALLKFWMFFGYCICFRDPVWFQVKAASDSQTKVAAFKELQALRLLPTCRWVGVKLVICGFPYWRRFFLKMEVGWGSLTVEVLNTLRFCRCPTLASSQCDVAGRMSFPSSICCLLLERRVLRSATIWQHLWKG